MKIVILDGYVVNPGDLNWDALSAMGELTVYDKTPPELAAERLAGAEIAIINKVKITDDLLAACPTLRYIGILATGYDNVDVAACRARGVAVAAVPAYSSDAVAQLTMALLLEICDGAGHHDRAVHEGRWTESGYFSFWDFPIRELHGMTMGIIGLGSIGRRTACLAAAFGMHVIACTRTASPAAAAAAELVSLEELLRRSDVISLHCPLTEETRGLINRDTIAYMKNGVILLNTSRGGVICEADLAEALRSGKVGAAAVDVVSSEPISPDNPLLGAPNCIITPHIAWAAESCRERLIAATAENLRSFLSGGTLNRIV